MSLNYKQKYLKYKLKYLTTKKLYGGMVPIDNPKYPNPRFQEVMIDTNNIHVESNKIGMFYTNDLKEELSKKIEEEIEEKKRDLLKNYHVINNKTFDYKNLEDIANLLIDIYYDGAEHNDNKIKNYLINYCEKEHSDLHIDNVKKLKEIAIEYLDCISTKFMEDKQPEIEHSAIEGIQQEIDRLAIEGIQPEIEHSAIEDIQQEVDRLAIKD